MGLDELLLKIHKYCHVGICMDDLFGVMNHTTSSLALVRSRYASPRFRLTPSDCKVKSIIKNTVDVR